jgi:hypothetical protein
VRVVVDTNVWISGLLTARGNPARIVDALEAGAFEPAVSPALLDELQAAARKPRIVRRSPEIGRGVDRLVPLLRERSVLVSPARSRAVARDPDDDEVLAVAIAAGATHVVSGDRDLIDDEAVRSALAAAGVVLMTPAEFAASLQAQRGDAT